MRYSASISKYDGDAVVFRYKIGIKHQIVRMWQYVYYQIKVVGPLM